MELQIVALIISCGASFALGMYVSSQVEKGVNRRITKEYFTKRNKFLEVKMSVPDGLEFNKPYNIDAIPEDIKIKEDQLMAEQEEKVDYPRTGGLSPDTGPRH